jgi:hypothetical protein
LAGDLNAKHPFWNGTVSNPSGKNYWTIWRKLLWNFRASISHSLLQCGKWWCARYCGPPKCSAVRSHCLWCPGLRSPTSIFSAHWIMS